MEDHAIDPDQPRYPALSSSTFFSNVAAELAGSLEEIIGLEDACGFIALVGGRIGEELSDSYAKSGGLDDQTPPDVGAICAHLKSQIGGSFEVEEASDEQIILKNCNCPFGDRVLGRPSLCMMTTNVIGRVASNALGYARVHIKEAIATGHDGCRVVVSLKQHSTAPGYEFFQ